MNFPKFEIYKGQDDHFYFRLLATNGQNILSSQGYTTKAKCQNGIESVKSNALDAAHFEVREAADGRYYFILLAVNKQVIGTSQMYANKRNCEEGIQSVQHNAPHAPVEDATV